MHFHDSKKELRQIHLGARDMMKEKAPVKDFEGLPMPQKACGEINVSRRAWPADSFLRELALKWSPCKRIITVPLQQRGAPTFPNHDPGPAQ